MGVALLWNFETEGCYPLQDSASRKIGTGCSDVMLPGMHIAALPFSVTTWSEVEATEHPGETGVALWRTQNFGEIRVRLVEYSPGYLADHWCSKGHIILCLEGQLDTELRDGRKFTLRPGMSYQVGDNDGAHRSSTQSGAKLFIVD
jgi:hypothetical protein